jgi:hypothetical protein
VEWQGGRVYLHLGTDPGLVALRIGATVDTGSTVAAGMAVCLRVNDRIGFSAMSSRTPGTSPITRNSVDRSKFNPAAVLPYSLRLQDFELAMQDVYDFFYDVNSYLVERRLQRLDDMLRPANMSGMLSDMLTSSVAKHSRSLTVNLFHNGHPDLIVDGVYPGNKVKAGSEGIEIKSTRKRGGAVDTHGAREQWLCTFVYEVDNTTEPKTARRPMAFTEAYLAHVGLSDFRRNPRGELGTRTATLDRAGLVRFRENWIYRL